MKMLELYLSSTKEQLYSKWSANDGTPSYTSGQLKAFVGLGSFELVLYVGLLAMALYNSYFFLYRQKRYRIYFIMVFYVFAYIVILMRIALSLMLIVIANNFDEYLADKGEKGVNAVLTFLVIEIGATYAKICMGFFQAVAIIILTL